MIGYSPDAEFLEAHGIRFDPETERPYTDPETLESDRKGIYLAGVLVAGMHTNEIFIENGRFHGKKIAEAIASDSIARYFEVRLVTSVAPSFNRPSISARSLPSSCKLGSPCGGLCARIMPLRSITTICGTTGRSMTENPM